jgi:hypothetical protein
MIWRRSHQYYWRVQAINSKDSSDWSETFSFSTKLSEPNLLYPDDNATRISITDVLKWESVLHASGYQVQVSKNEDFVNKRMDAITADTTYQLNNIEHSNSYYWRVRSFSTRDTSDWSVVRSFETNNIAPVLISPYNMELDVAVSGFINWLAMPLALRYSFEIAKDSLFERIVLSDTSITDNFYYYVGLESFNTIFLACKSCFRG